MAQAHESIERVYREEADRIWRALLGYTSSRELASDALAEAFAQALGRGESIASVRDWVWTDAFKIAAGMSARGDAAMPLRDGEAALPEPVVDLVRALASLPERQRLCVVMHDYADRPVGEIATVLGIVKPTVYAHLRQGRRHLRAMLEVEDA